MNARLKRSAAGFAWTSAGTKLAASLLLTVLVAACAMQPDGDTLSQSDPGAKGISTIRAQSGLNGKGSASVAAGAGRRLGLASSAARLSGDADDALVDSTIAGADDIDADANNGALSHAAPLTADIPDTSSFRQTGAASYYGSRFHGRRTASGERYDMHEFTAAHRSLPLNSYVRVTNLANNKSVIVKINDRGPYRGHRILDVSEAAAQALGMTHAGTGRVRISGMSPEEARAALSQPILASN